jgi:hypothetical protein
MNVRQIILPLLPLLLQGCGNPYDQPDTWHAAWLNRANLDAEAVRKSDTVAGHGDPGSDAILDTAAVIRLHEDKTKPLESESTTSTIGGASTTQ